MIKFFLPVLSLTAIATPVSAQADIETRVVAVADLDLDSQAGRQALDRRLTRAVVEVCGTASDVDVVGKNMVRECRVRTLASARAVGEQRIAARTIEAIRVAAR